MGTSAPVGLLATSPAGPLAAGPFAAASNPGSAVGGLATAPEGPLESSPVRAVAEIPPKTPDPVLPPAVCGA